MKKNIDIIKFIKPYIAKYIKQVGIAIIFLIAAAAITLCLPIGVRWMLDAGIHNIKPENIKESVELRQTFHTMFILIIALAIASTGRYYYVIWIGERIVADIRYDTFKHITKLSAEFFDKNKTGELISHITNDTLLIKSVAGATASMALRNILLMTGAVIAMVYTSPYLSMIVLITLPFIIAPMLIMGRIVKNRTRKAQDELANAGTNAMEAIAAIKTIQAFTQEKQIIQKFKKNIIQTFNAAKKSFAARAYLAFFAILTIFTAILVVIWIGTREMINNEMSAGMLGQFVIYSIIAASAMGSLSEVWGEIAQAAGAAQRLAETINKKTDVKISKNTKDIKKPVKGNVIFENVQFAYPTKIKKIVLKNINFKIKQGEKIAVVGTSGAGKSSMINVMLRHYDIQKGKIKIDGQDIKNINIKNLRECIGIVPQEDALFATTIFENILFAKPDAQKKEVLKAAQDALVEPFVKELVNGYQTMLAEKGLNLSAGQRQRIMIARAMLKNAPILILDEATSALDAKNEKIIQKALEKLMKNRTTIIIAHRLATIVNADRILVVDKGEIIENGNHQKLIKNNGLYAKLANIQLKNKP